MRVDVTPQRAQVTPGQPVVFSVTLTNTSEVIGGYVVRVLGVDPSWVELESDDISLFPDETRTFTATVQIPEGIAAGTRRVAVQIRELTPPLESRVVELDLVVPAAPAVHARLDPLAVHAGRSGSLTLVVTNTGNTQVDRVVHGDDPEGKVKFAVTPERVALAPGEHAVVDVRARARRRLLGAMAVRKLSFYLDDPAREAEAPPPPAPPRRFGVLKQKLPATARDDKDAVASATMMQRPVVARGGLSLLGLLAAVTVFGLVITLALGKLVGQSAADRDLALQIAAAQEASALGGTSSVSGTVTLLTTGAPVPSVSVALYEAGDPATPLTTTATDQNGRYTIENLPAGDYKLAYRGSGLLELWYPGAISADDAADVTIKPDANVAGLDVRLGGLPASIAGTVSGEDVGGATVTLETLPTFLPASGTASSGTASTATAAAGAASGAIVDTVPVAADGGFVLENVPSPSIYVLKVSKPGYATSTQRIDVGAGEDRKGVTIALRKGDGIIRGVVTSAGGPVGQATVTATAGETTVSTVSLTEGEKGAFTLRDLPTPATVTLTVSKAGFGSQTLTLSLAQGQQLTGVSVALSTSSGSLSGVVTAQDGSPAPSVAVTVTNGALTVVTQTGSGGARGREERIGEWYVGGLPAPGTYTVTFERPDLVAQTVSVSLGEGGTIIEGAQGAQVTDSDIRVRMQSATASVHGTVHQLQTEDRGGDRAPVGEATVQLTSGSATYTVTTASVPSEDTGRFRIDHLPPGTYTLSVSRRGTSPTSSILNLRAGQNLDVAAAKTLLAAPASIRGTVVATDGTAPRAGWTVQLYVASQYPQVVTETVETAADGSFAFEGIDAPQAYVVVVRPTAGSAPAGSVSKQIRASQQMTVKIEADPPE